MLLFTLLAPRLTQTIPALLGLLATLLAQDCKPASEIQDLLRHLDRLFTAWKAAKPEIPPEITEQDPEDFWEFVLVYDHVRAEPRRAPIALPRHPALPLPVRRKTGLVFQSETRVLFVPIT